MAIQMNQTETLTLQTQNAYQWVDNLIAEIPNEKRDDIPEGIASSINWQVGHLLTSSYYHTIMCITGHRKDILSKIPIKEYSQYFSPGNPKDVAGNVDPNVLWDHLKMMMDESVKTISALTAEDLNAELEPTKFKHPIAKIKFEAVDWNIKHTMWHCGQIAVIKRLIGNRYDFGLK